MSKTIIGIAGGLGLAAVAIGGSNFFDPHHQLEALWLALSLLAWPLVGWGAFHFARYRGYDGALGCGLLALSVPIYMFLVHRSHRPLVYALGFAFAVSLPVVVLLALPRKRRRSHRHRHRRHNEGAPST